MRTITSWTSRAALFTVLSLLAAAAPASSDPALGIWRTEPDRKDLVSDIEIRRCGTALCGRVIRAMTQDGTPVDTPNIGRELFWDMQPQGGGSYGGGVVFVPLLNAKGRATMELQGDRLIVQGCKLGICGGQTWTRVR